MTAREQFDSEARVSDKDMEPSEVIFSLNTALEGASSSFCTDLDTNIYCSMHANECGWRIHLHLCASL